VRVDLARRAAAPLLALLPMAVALAGVAFDQRDHLGFTLWSSACRSAGLTPASVMTFTLQLLPSAVIGALLGGLLVLCFGILLRRSGALADISLAAHVGCLIGMAVGMLLCMALLPPTLMLAVEPLLAATAAAWLWRHSCSARPAASVKPPSRQLTSA
jgi:hypothetical protein